MKSTVFTLLLVAGAAFGAPSKSTTMGAFLIISDIRTPSFQFYQYYSGATASGHRCGIVFKTLGNLDGDMLNSVLQVKAGNPNGQVIVKDDQLEVALPASPNTAGTDYTISSRDGSPIRETIRKLGGDDVAAEVIVEDLPCAQLSNP